jgi:hypothetical protein
MAAKGLRAVFRRSVRAEIKMVKYFTLMTVKANQDAAQFRHWFLREHAPQVLKHCPSLRRYIVNLAEPAPAIEHGTGYSSTRYQVVTEISLDSAEDFSDRNRLYDSSASARNLESALETWVGESYTYRVTEYVEKDAHPIFFGERSPGVKMIPFIGWKEGLSEKEGRLGWEVHGPLALSIHVGFSKYVRNVVEEIITLGAPRYGGIGILQFVTHNDAIHRLLPTPDAARIIAWDIARWLVIHGQFDCGEYVLK